MKGPFFVVGVTDAGHRLFLSKGHLRLSPQKVRAKYSIEVESVGERQVGERAVGNIGMGSRNTL